MIEGGCNHHAVADASLEREQGVGMIRVKREVSARGAAGHGPPK